MASTVNVGISVPQTDPSGVIFRTRHQPFRQGRNASPSCRDKRPDPGMMGASIDLPGSPIMRPFPMFFAILVLRPVVMALGVSCLIASTLSVQVHADTIYQYRDAQGHLVLSDQKPPPSARQVKVHTDASNQVNGPIPTGGPVGSGVPLPSHANAPLPSTGLDPVSTTAGAPVSTGNPDLDAFNRRQADKAKAQADRDAAVTRAQAVLDQALADQKAGQQLKPSEQTYAGYAQTYEQRQQGLADAVAQAQAALLNARTAAKP